ncbi:CcdC protein domain-containing protein [Caulobacter sp. NIBR2454]|uniref:CcdC protein domain-containing protein n=1 Tax=Caulobacter sp. NIBR2454 TaxID=3015996 RepID=UPI0022B64BEE|nr:CcdC protein domain-containing protein [Caulobacter sp. NIBR2454]
MTIEQAAHYWPYVAVPIAAVVVMIRLHRMKTHRPMRLRMIWVLPLAMSVLAGLLLWRFPPQGLEWIWLGAIFALGGAVGWRRGRMVDIILCDQTYSLKMRATPAAIFLFVGLVLFRAALRPILEAESAVWHVRAALITDGFIVFAVGLVVMARIEMATRALRLLTQAKTAA